MIQGAARFGKDKIMHFRKIAAGAAAIMMALVCGCSVRSSSDAAWPTGKVSDKKALTVSYDAFSKEYKYWLLVNQIPDDTADEVKDKCRSQRESIINYLVNEKIVLEQAKNYGVDQFTDEELDSIFVKSDYKLVQVDLKKIMYIEGLKDYIKIYTEDAPKPILSLMSMKAMEELLPSSRFIRVHRSFIVQKDKIRVIDRGRIVFDKTYIPISDSYKQVFQTFLDERS